MKYQYYLILLSICVLTNGLMGQKIVSLTNFYTDSYKNIAPELNEGDYVKDTDDVLSPYVGYWHGTYKDKVYEIYIKKATKVLDADGIYTDCLNMDLRIYYPHKGLSHTLIPSRKQAPIGWQYFHKAKTYTYLLIWGNRDEDCGRIVTKLEPDGRLRFYLTQSNLTPYTKDLSIVPFFDLYTKQGDQIQLVKRSDRDIEPTRLKCPKNFDYSSPYQFTSKLLEAGRVYLWDKATFRYFTNECISLLSITEVSSLEYFSKKLKIYSYRSGEYMGVLQPEDKPGDLFHQSYQIAIPRYLKEKYDEAYMQPLLYQQLCTVYMLQELKQQSNKDQALKKKLEDTEYFNSDFSRLFDCYAEVLGVSSKALADKFISEGVEVLHFTAPQSPQAYHKSVLISFLQNTSAYHSFSEDERASAESIGPTLAIN